VDNWVPIDVLDSCHDPLARIEVAARALGIRTLVLNVSRESGFDQALQAEMTPSWRTVADGISRP
jgi:hypothetical protein